MSRDPAKPDEDPEFGDSEPDDAVDADDEGNEPEAEDADEVS